MKYKPVYVDLKTLNKDENKCHPEKMGWLLFIRQYNLIPSNFVYTETPLVFKFI